MSTASLLRPLCMRHGEQAGLPPGQPHTYAARECWAHMRSLMWQRRRAHGSPAAQTRSRMLHDEAASPQPGRPQKHTARERWRTCRLSSSKDLELSSEPGSACAQKTASQTANCGPEDASFHSFWPTCAATPASFAAHAYSSTMHT